MTPPKRRKGGIKGKEMTPSKRKGGEELRGKR
jgi:hypothetical protein